MDDVKKGYREAEETTKETWRKSDGEDLADKVGNAGDDIRNHDLRRIDIGQRRVHMIGAGGRDHHAVQQHLHPVVVETVDDRKPRHTTRLEDADTGRAAQKLGRVARLRNA